MITHARYLVRVAMRPTYKGSPLKPEVDGLDGKELVLHAGQPMGELERYPGEHMMSPVDRDTSELLMEHGIGWIAEGDVEVLARMRWDDGAWTAESV